MKYQEFKPFWYLTQDQMSVISDEDNKKYTKYILWFFFIFTIISIVLVEFI